MPVREQVDTRLDGRKVDRRLHTLLEIPPNFYAIAFGLVGLARVWLLAAPDYRYVARSRPRAVRLRCSASTVPGVLRRNGAAWWVVHGPVDRRRPGYRQVRPRLFPAHRSRWYTRRRWCRQLWPDRTGLDEFRYWNDYLADARRDHPQPAVLPPWSCGGTYPHAGDRNRTAGDSG